MNILEEIQNCPVEWKELGEVVEVLDSLRRPITKSQRIPGDIPYYGANGIQDYVKDWIFDGTFILMGEDGSVIKNDNSPILHWVIGKIWVNNHAHILGEVPGCALLKYVYYVLSQTDVSDIVRGTPPKLNQKNLKSIKIPIPPLEIQEKIVQILDKFTDYVTELTSELTSRKKQYSFYRDKLLSFEDEVYQVEWKKLNECLKKGKGTKITASQMKLLHKDGAPIRIFAGGKTYADVNYGDIPDKDIHTEEAIVVKSRGIIDFEYCTEPFSFKNEFWSYSSDNENINLRYIYHYLVHNKEHFQNIANNMQMPQISSNDTEKFKIPVPSLEIQSRIVQVLDNFDMVCNDLNIGLPKEIELRQKQYEYFREKLLTFVAEGEYTDSTVQYSTVQTRHH